MDSDNSDSDNGNYNYCIFFLRMTKTVLRM